VAGSISSPRRDHERDRRIADCGMMIADLRNGDCRLSITAIRSHHSTIRNYRKRLLTSSQFTRSTTPRCSRAGRFWYLR
jgi:hypothetical protein